MNRPLALLPLCLLALLTTQISTAHAQKAGRAKAVQGSPAAAKAAPSKQSLRLVVQQGQHRLSNGFILFSPDGRLVATGDGGGGDVVVWEAASGREVRRLSDNTDAPGAQDVDGWLWGAFSADGRLLATSNGPNVRLWDLWTGKRQWLATHGVNAYENEEWDLRFAANDARRLQEVVAARVREGGEYEEVVSVPLISDYASDGGRKQTPRVLKETGATKFARRRRDAVLSKTR